MLQEATILTNKNRHISLLEYAISNLQANKKILGWIKTAYADSSVFKEMLLHIWQAESAWLACLQCTTDIFTATADIKEIVDGCLEISGKLSDYVLSLNETQIRETIRVYIPGVIDCDIPRYELIQMCFDHSKYHRDQIKKMALFTNKSDLN